MEGPVPAAWILKTKKASAPHGTKAFASAIPPKLTSCDVHSLLRTIMRTPRITGGFPSDPTWENFPFKPPSEIFGAVSKKCHVQRSNMVRISAKTMYTASCVDAAASALRSPGSAGRSRGPGRMPATTYGRRISRAGSGGRTAITAHHSGRPKHVMIHRAIARL